MSLEDHFTYKRVFGLGAAIGVPIGIYFASTNTETPPEIAAAIVNIGLYASIAGGLCKEFRPDEPLESIISLSKGVVYPVASYCAGFTFGGVAGVLLSFSQELSK